MPAIGPTIVAFLSWRQTGNFQNMDCVRRKYYRLPAAGPVYVFATPATNAVKARPPRNSVHN
jgi:hypothetical protein